MNHTGDASYESVSTEFCKLTDIVRPFTDSDVHHLPDTGNEPSFRYILRNHEWKGGE